MLAAGEQQQGVLRRRGGALLGRRRRLVAAVLCLVLLSFGALWSVILGGSFGSRLVRIEGGRSIPHGKGHGGAPADEALIGVDAHTRRAAPDTPEEPARRLLDPPGNVPLSPRAVIPAYVLGPEDAADRRLSHVIVPVHSSDFVLSREGPLYGDSAVRVWNWRAGDVQPCMEGPPSEALYPSGKRPHLLFVVAFPVGGVRSLRPQCLDLRKPRYSVRVKFAATLAPPRDSRTSSFVVFFNLGVDNVGVTPRLLVRSEPMRDRLEFEWREVQLDDLQCKPHDVLYFNLWFGDVLCGTARGTLRNFTEGFEIRNTTTGQRIAFVRASVRVIEVFGEADFPAHDALVAEVERIVTASLGSALDCFSGLSVRGLKVPFQDDNHDFGSRIVWEALMLGGHWLYGETLVQYGLLLETDVTAVRKYWLDAMAAEVVLSVDSFWVKGSTFIGNTNLLLWGSDPDKLDARTRGLSDHINGNAIWAFGSSSFRDFYFNVVRPWMLVNAPRRHVVQDCTRIHAWNYDFAIFFYMAANFRSPVVRRAPSKMIVTERIANMWRTNYRLSDLAPSVYLVHGGQFIDADAEDIGALVDRRKDEGLKV